MFKQKLKSIAFLSSILILSFASALFILAWTSPAEVPPGGNVDTPINVGTSPQAKAGRISATEFYDYNDNAYYLDPDGQSVLAGPVGIGTVSPSASLDIAGDGVSGPSLEVADTRLVAFKYGPAGFNVTGAPIILKYTYSGGTYGKNFGSWLIELSARDDSNEYLHELWYFEVNRKWSSTPGANATFYYDAHRISGTKNVRLFETSNTGTSGNGLQLEWELSNDGAGFNDSVEITVMELSAGHDGGHIGTWEAITYASRGGGTEKTRGGTGHATFGGTGYHWLMGKVGIGTTSPGYALSVVGDINITGDFRQNGTIFEGGGESPWSTCTNGICYNAGNVGIGVEDPDYTLEVQITEYAAGGIKVSDPDDTIATIGDWAGTGEIGAVRLFYEGTENVRILSSGDSYFTGGDVGIGTTDLSSPFDDKPLVIQGIGTGHELVGYRDASGTAKWHWNMYGDGLNLAETGVADGRLFIEYGGDVGIGTRSPAENLHVAGKIAIGDSTPKKIYESGGDLIIDISN